VNEKEGPPKI
jgi:hypothetical protein